MNIIYNIDKTILNCELAEELIEKTDDKRMKRELTEKNERRKSALKNMRREIRDEAIDKENRYE
ncbi:small acid-soluble spore protein Tlp [Clostridium saccharobutylicum]|nr:small acid-soluble spore protein Tlp [Clostridium saccharobutylicum]MBC2403726.1 small acid-soluble spore protein Tlp [Clostridium saccharobutylicum]MBC2414614.1 small acid-soluble spore protein Tlp [Clostridium saccharobutylicum]MBC2442220.1 small acid-soluble spore protein Tlp [Clostridium saccharobutylicum]MBC2446771.1 small acid-soluble spore protein Tlp [Clostridium saccharobutylicum]MBC2450806.1 small acid-soluble spore protein Tlp [Clostridium saccharobutylicum]